MRIEESFWCVLFSNELVSSLKAFLTFGLRIGHFELARFLAGHQKAQVTTCYLYSNLDVIQHEIRQ